ncbi:hypothetical protein EJ110_NYTH59576 [Nymphaea thermarum]|nr:hypothetical protein EJ110_NYTH59576 [Nymphaea thermarum]
MCWTPLHRPFLLSLFARTFLSSTRVLSPCKYKYLVLVSPTRQPLSPPFPFCLPLHNSPPPLPSTLPSSLRSFHSSSSFPFALYALPPRKSPLPPLVPPSSLLVLSPWRGILHTIEAWLGLGQAQGPLLSRRPPPKRDFNPNEGKRFVGLGRPSSDGHPLLHRRPFTSGRQEGRRGLNRLPAPLGSGLGSGSSSSVGDVLGSGSGSGPDGDGQVGAALTGSPPPSAGPRQRQQPPRQQRLRQRRCPRQCLRQQHRQRQRRHPRQHPRRKCSAAPAASNSARQRSAAPGGHQQRPTAPGGHPQRPIALGSARQRSAAPVSLRQRSANVRPTTLQLRGGPPQSVFLNSSCIIRGLGLCPGSISRLRQGPPLAGIILLSPLSRPQEGLGNGGVIPHGPDSLDGADEPPGSTLRGPRNNWYQSRLGESSYSSGSRDNKKGVVPYGRSTEKRTYPNPNREQGRRPSTIYLTPKEIEVCRRKGLCYKCKAKWDKYHVCPVNLRVEVISDEETSSSSNIETSSSSESSSSSSSEEKVVTKRRTKKSETKEKGKEKGESSTKEEPPKETESLHSMQDPNKPNSMKVFGKINGRRILILLDGGSTKNFLTEEVAEKCKVTLEPSRPQTIIVGGGLRLQSDTEGKDVEVIINKRPFKIEFLVIPLEGIDLILGMPWFFTLGIISWDVKRSTMTFTPDGTTEPMTLQGVANSINPKAAMRAVNTEQPWEGPDRGTSWEEFGQVAHRFPSSSARGQAQSREGESDTDPFGGPSPIKLERADGRRRKRKASDMWAQPLHCIMTAPKEVSTALKPVAVGGEGGAAGSKQVPKHGRLQEWSEPSMGVGAPRSVEPSEGPPLPYP